MKKILFTGSGGVGSQILWDCLKKKYILYFGDEFINKIHQTGLITKVVPDTYTIYFYFHGP